MADTYINKVGSAFLTSATYTGSGTGTNSHDENAGTAFIDNDSNPAAATAEFVFTRAFTLNSIVYRMTGTGTARGKYNHWAGAVWYIQYATTGAYINLAGASEGGGSIGDSGDSDESYGYSFDTGTVTYSTPIAGVTKLKAYMYAYAAAAEDTGSTAASSIYEVQGWGSKYKDVGIRYYNSHTSPYIFKVGVEDIDEDVHKFRIYVNGTVYGIPIVDTADSNASPIRVYSGSAVKAFPKI